LGLSISHEIVRRHGGTMTAQSDGKGARFEIVLPEHTGLEPSRPTPPRSQAPTTGARARILLIDDEEMLRRVLKATLRDHDVELAEDGAAALAIVRRDQAFDVILCDLMMPNVDGPAFFDILSVEFPHLVERVVFVTGGVFTSRARDFLARVPARVLDKPLGLDVLRGVVAEMLARGRPRASGPSGLSGQACQVPEPSG
jgi:CheY-like chemotaxis protein